MASHRPYQDEQDPGSLKLVLPCEIWEYEEYEESAPPRILSLESIQQGLDLMAKGLLDGKDKPVKDHYLQHFADFLAGNDDATTGDIFLQLCLFGEVIYG